MFWDWVVENYVVAVAVGIRRQADRDKRVISMHRLLDELKENAHLLTRKWYVAAYTRGKPKDDMNFWTRSANKDFDQFAPRNGRRISKTLIRRDQARLQGAAARIRHYVNRRVAHRDQRRFKMAVTYADLHKTLDELEALLKRCSLLLTRAGLLTAEPEIVEDWQSVFRVPWIRAIKPHSMALEAGAANGDAGSRPEMSEGRPA